MTDMDGNLIKAENEHKKCHELLDLTDSGSESGNETLLDPVISQALALIKICRQI